MKVNTKSFRYGHLRVVLGANRANNENNRFVRA